MILYYNESCSKCRTALGLLQEQGCEPEIRNYLDVPPTEDELRALLGMLGCSARDLARKSEPLFEAEFSTKDLSEDEWIAVLARNPVLIERPILISGNQAVIGRPPAMVLDIIR